MTSVMEAILARVALALSGVAGGKVFRARDDAFGPDDLAAVNVRRGSTDAEILLGRTNAITVEWLVECFVRGGEVETAADALHMDAHAAMMSDSPLAGLGRGLRCVGTSIETDSAESRVAKLTARYQMQTLVGVDDLTKQLN